MQEYEKAFESVLDYAVESAAQLMAATTGNAAVDNGLIPAQGSAGAAAAPDPAARAEASAALDSAFPLSAVARWVTLPPAERLAQLQRLAKLTLGICLYNGAAAAAAAAGANMGSVESGARPRRSRDSGSRSSRSGSHGSGAGAAASSWGSALAPSAAVQMQQGVRLVQDLSAAEGAAWVAFSHANKRRMAGKVLADEAEGDEVVVVAAPEGDAVGAALFCAQAASMLRDMGADARQGLAACEALDAALRSELDEVGAWVDLLQLIS